MQQPGFLSLKKCWRTLSTQRLFLLSWREVWRGGAPPAVFLTATLSCFPVFRSVAAIGIYLSRRSIYLCRLVSRSTFRRLDASRHRLWNSCPSLSSSPQVPRARGRERALSRRRLHPRGGGRPAGRCYTHTHARTHTQSHTHSHTRTHKHNHTNTQTQVAKVNHTCQSC